LQSLPSLITPGLTDGAVICGLANVSLQWLVLIGGSRRRHARCQRRIDPAAIWNTVRWSDHAHERAPTLMNMEPLGGACGGALQPSRPVQAGTEALRRLRRWNGWRSEYSGHHLYGLTETGGPAVVNQWQPEGRKTRRRAVPANARQGMHVDRA
jgi:hypothetical protein